MVWWIGFCTGFGCFSWFFFNLLTAFLSWLGDFMSFVTSVWERDWFFYCFKSIAPASVRICQNNYMRVCENERVCVVLFEWLYKYVCACWCMHIFAHMHVYVCWHINLESSSRKLSKSIISYSENLSFLVFYEDSYWNNNMQSLFYIPCTCIIVVCWFWDRRVLALVLVLGYFGFICVTLCETSE